MTDEVVGAPDWPALTDAALLDGVPHSLLTDLCIELAEVTGAGISLMTPAGNSGLVYASSDIAARVDELQFVLGEGPCVDAFADGQPVFVADLEDPAEGVAGHWPGFVEEALELGVRAVFAIPLSIGAIRLGVMDLYRTEPGPLSAGQLASALLVADVAALSLLHTSSGDTDFVADPADRSTFRVEVHQATGMITAQTGRSLADALILLRAHAFAEGRPISEIASEVLTGRLTFPLEDV